MEKYSKQYDSVSDIRTKTLVIILRTNLVLLKLLLVQMKLGLLKKSQIRGGSL